MKTIIGYGNGSGSTVWRLEFPFKYLRKEGYEAFVSHQGINDKDSLRADVVVLKGTVDREGISTLLAAREVGKKLKIVVDIDDALFTNPSNPYSKEWEVRDATFVITQTIKVADLVTCATPYLREQLIKLNKNVEVLPNYYDPDWFNIKPIENTDGSVRIGWAGSFTHIEDLRYIAPVINALMKKYPRVKFIACGDKRFKDLLEYKSRVEICQPVPIEVWPKYLTSMALDIGIAPLVNDEFNRCKSPIKWLEYSLAKIPSVCSRIVYSSVTDNTANTIAEWEDKLELLILDRNYRSARSKYEQDRAKKYDINQHYRKYIKTYGL